MRKRVISILLTACMMLALLPSQVSAEKSKTDIAYPVTGGNIYFDPATGTITDCDKGVTSADIPNSIDGVSVTSIGNLAFYACSGLTSATIPDGVTIIGNSAFSGCTGMTSVNIPDGVTSIGNNAFASCRGLTSMTIPYGVTSIGNSAFYYCSGLTSVTIPDSVTSIGGSAFTGCSGLTSVTIPYGVTSIEYSTFNGCSSLTSVAIPNSVTSIGSGAFQNCKSLTSVIIPDSVTEIGTTVFASCSSLTSVTIPDSITRIENTVFYKCSGLTSVTIPDSVTSIGSNAFAYCSGLTSVTIPDRVTSIGGSAFCYCTGLTSITIPNGVTSIGGDAFAYCRGLTNVTIPDSVTSIGSQAFFHCSGLTSVTIPGSVNSIGGRAFESCSGLTSVTIHKGVNSIGGYAFQNCNKLTSVTIPEGVSSIGDYAFEKCSGLTSVTINKGVTSIGNYAFQNCNKLMSVAIPDGVTSIGDSAFNQCYWLTSVTIPDSVTRIGIYAFYVGRLTDVYYSGSETQWKAIEHGMSDVYTKATIHYNSTGPDPFSAAVSFSKGKYQFRVVDPNGASLQGVTVTCDGKNGFTDSEGLVSFDITTADTPVVTAELSGYTSWSNAGSDGSMASSHYETIILYPESLGEFMLSSCRYSNFPEMTFATDLLTMTKTVSLGNDLPCAGDLDFGKFYVKCASGAPGNAVSHYELWQGTERIALSLDGFFELSTDSFKKDGGCFVRVVTSSLDEVDTKINLEFSKQEINAATEISLDGGSVAFSVGDDVPFLGGSTLNFDFPVSIPLTYLQTKDKLQIGFNVDPTGGDSIEEQLKEARDLMRYAKRAGDFKSGVLTEKDKKIFQSLIKNKNGFKTIEGIRDIEVSVLGYFEADRESRTAKGSIILQLALDPVVHFGYTTLVVVVPVTVNIELSLEGELTAELSYDLKNAELLGTLDIGFTPQLTAFGGAGVDKYVGVGAYGGAGLSVLFRILATNMNTGMQNVELTGELGLKAYFGPLTYERPFAYNTWTLYTANNARMFSDGDNWLAGINDAESYKPHDLSYLEDESEWMGEQIALYSAAASTALTPLLTDTYRNAQPVMAAGDDGIYAAFLRADAATGDVYAAVTKYDGTRWSGPVRADSSAVLDGAPSLCVAKDGTVWMAYAKTGQGCDTRSLTDFARKQSIVVGTVDPDTLAFTEVKAYSGSGYAHLQQLEVINGVPTLAWVDSAVTDDNSVLWPESSTIYKAAYNGSWGEAEQAAAVNKPVTQLTVGGKNGAAALAYTVDEDGDYLTDDIALYCDGVKLADNVQGRVSYGWVSGMEKADFVWNGDGCLESAGGRQIAAEGISGEYVLADDRIYYSAAGETGAQLTAVVFDNGEWSVPVTLTGGERYLENLSVVSWNGGEYLMGMDTLATITETEVTDAKNLVWSKIMPSSDLRLDSISYDHDGLVSGEAVELTLTVTNAGDHTVSAIEAWRRGGESRTVECDLRPGESTDIAWTIICPETVTEYEFSVLEQGEEDFTPDDNTAAVKVGYASLAVSVHEQRIGSSQALQAIVTNNGIAPADGCVRFTGGDGTVLDEIPFEALSAGDSAVIIYPGSFANGDYTASLVCDDDATSLFDSADTVHIERSSEIQSVNVKNNTVYAAVFAGESGLAYCAVYDANEKQIEVCQAAVSAGAQEIEFSFSTLKAADTVKVFLLDENSAPQCRAESVSAK